MILCRSQHYHPFALESLVRQQKTKGDNTSKDFVTQVTVCVGIDLPTIFTIFTTQFNKKWLITILLDIKVFYLIGFNSLLDIKVFYLKLTSRDKSPANNVLPLMIKWWYAQIFYIFVLFWMALMIACFTCLAALLLATIFRMRCLRFVF